MAAGEVVRTLSAVLAPNHAIAESSVEEAQPWDSLAGGVFVGRQREMGELNFEVPRRQG